MRFIRLLSTLGASVVALAASDAPVIDPNSEIGQGQQLGQANIFERQQIAHANIFNRRQGGCNAHPRGCINNVCARAVKDGGDGAPALTSRQEDCSSFMHKTVSYDLTTTVSAESANVKRRQPTIGPSDVPSYVTTACTDAEKYSSACSCWGITASTTTVSSVATVTVEPSSITASSTPISSVPSESSVISSVASGSSAISSLASESSAVPSISSVASVSSVSPSVSSVASESSVGPAVSSVVSASVGPSSVSAVASSSVEPSATPMTTGIGMIQARRADNGAVVGYLKAGSAQLATFDTNANNAIQFRIVAPASSNIVSRFNLELVNADRGAYFGLVVGRDSTNSDMAAGSYHYLYPGPVSQSTDPGSVPQDVPSYYKTLSGLSKQAETSVWTINFSTGDLTAQWINSGGGHPNTVFFSQSNYLYAGGDAAAFMARYPSTVTTLTLHWAWSNQVMAAPTIE